MGSPLKKAIKTLIGLSIFLSVFRYSSAADLQPTTIRDFSCGLVNTYDPTTIGDGCAQDLQNVDIWTGRIQKRRGSILQNSTPLTGNQPIRFLHEFPDQNGNFWMIAVSSNTIWKSNNAGATWSVLTSTHGVSSTSDFSAVNAFGKVRLTDGTTNWILFDGSAVTVSTTSQKGKLSAFYYQRVWTADVTGARSTLYASRINDPEDWTNDGIDSGDSLSLFIRQNDGYPIRALIVFKGQLLVFKDYSIDAVSITSDGLTPRVDPVSNNKGTQHPRSVQLTENTVIFLADDGFYEYDGVSIHNISGDIMDTDGAILQGNSNSRSYTETSQTDFSAGALDRVSATIQSGSVVLSTNQFIDTEQTQWQAGSVGSGLSTTYSSGAVVLPSNGLVDDFSDGDFTANPTWSVLGSTPTVDSSRVKWSTGAAQGLYLNISQSTGTWRWSYEHDDSADDGMGVVVLSSFAFTSLSTSTMRPSTGYNKDGYFIYMFPVNGLFALESGTVSAAGFSSPGAGNNNYKLVITSSSASLYINEAEAVTISRSSYTNLSYLTFGVMAYIDSGPALTVPAYFDNFSITPDTATGITSSTFTSRSFSVGRNETIVGQFTATDTLNSGTITYAVYSDSNTAADINQANTFISSASVTNGAAFSLVYSSYVFYSANFQRAQTNYTPTLRDVQIDIKASTGAFISQDISLGSSASSFGPFRTSDSGSSLTYVLFTDTDTNMTYTDASTFVTSQTVTNNATPSIAIDAHARVGAFLTAASYSATPSLDAYTVSWVEGSGSFPVASLYFDQDYIIAVSTSNTTRNDTMLVLDRNRRWTKYTGMNAYSMARYSQRPYYGDASGGSVYRFQVDDVYTDNSTPIFAYWTSKEFDFGYPITDKTILRYYVTAKYQANSDVAFKYGVNRGNTTSATLDLDSISGFFRQSIVPSSLTYQRGISHRFQFSDSDTDDPFDILSVTLYPRLETQP
jgi:hypothetical protein